MAAVPAGARRGRAGARRRQGKKKGCADALRGARRGSVRDGTSGHLRGEKMLLEPWADLTKSAASKGEMLDGRADGRVGHVPRRPPSGQAQVAAALRHPVAATYREVLACAGARPSPALESVSVHVQVAISAGVHSAAHRRGGERASLP